MHYRHLCSVLLCHPESLTQLNLLFVCKSVYKKQFLDPIVTWLIIKKIDRLSTHPSISADYKIEALVEPAVIATPVKKGACIGIKFGIIVRIVVVFFIVENKNEGSLWRKQKVINKSSIKNRSCRFFEKLNYCCLVIFQKNADFFIRGDLFLQIQTIYHVLIH